MDFGKNKLREIQEKRRKERDEIKKFNKTEEGKALHEKVRKMHREQSIDPSDLPF